MKIVCSPNPTMQKDVDAIVFSMYNSHTSDEFGRVGSRIAEAVRRAGFAVDTVTWDFLTIALAVTAADQSCLRKRSPDGWTREINLSVALQSPLTWQPQAVSLENALGFLTGDIWKLEFEGDGPAPPPPAKHKGVSQKRPSGDIVCLLSGGLDSLVGAIDLVDQEQKPIFVSQRARGDSDRQCEFAKTIDANLTHLQLSHATHASGPSERSQRARSIIFLAYGLIAASVVQSHGDANPTKLIVPENGFISMNVPLTNLRIGTLSTRTTHPYFLKHIEAIWTAVGLNVVIQNPYQFMTKGELMQKCRNQDLLQKLASQSTSCGRFGRFKYRHCGRCIPCLIRRAAFLHYGCPDTTYYTYSDLHTQKDFDDVRSLAMACLQVENEGIDRWAAGSINYAELGDTTEYSQTVFRGIQEARQLLYNSHVL